MHIRGTADPLTMSIQGETTKIKPTERMVKLSTHAGTAGHDKGNKSYIEEDRTLTTLSRIRSP